MKFNTCLCAIIKNEPDLEEWIVYNHLIGFEHIFIYDNNSQIPIKVRLQKYRDFVTIIDFPGSGSLTQRAAYNHFRVNFGSLTKWVAYFDADEYLVMKQHKNVKELLSDFKDYDGIAINWMMFGPNGHDRRPDRLVIENYTTREKNYDFHIKSIVKPASIINCKVHDHIMRKGAQFVDLLKKSARFWWKNKLVPNNDVAQLNHYFTRSREDWKRRLNRGGLKRVNEKKRNWNDFNHYKKYCTTEDRLILNQGYANKIKEFIIQRNSLTCDQIQNNQVSLENLLLPTDFNWLVYLYLNPDIIKKECSEKFAINHWLKHGRQERRKYKHDGPDFRNFDWKFYVKIHKDLQKCNIDTEEKALKHFLLHGFKEKKKYHQ